MGIVVGWMINHYQQNSEQVELSTVLKVCPNFSNELALDNTSFESVKSPSSIGLSQPVSCEASMASIQQSEKIDPIILRLLSNRSILYSDLTELSHWHSFDDFEQYIDRFELNTSAVFRLLAKAHIYYNQNYVNALENLYSSKQSADDIESLNSIQGEINGLISFIRKTYFSLDPSINEAVFLRFMDTAYEKQPDYLPIILALIKHYRFVKDYTLAKNYIEAIPTIPNNQHVINLLTEQLTRAKNEGDALSTGIPMTKQGNHFVVSVSINQEIQLNLLLDTGATRTVVSSKTMRSMMLMSQDIINLDVFQHVNTANGRSISHLFQAKELDVGGFKLKNPLILTANLVEDDNIHGLLGMDFLGQFQFRIDHQKNRLLLSY